MPPHYQPVPAFHGHPPVYSQGQHYGEGFGVPVNYHPLQHGGYRINPGTAHPMAGVPAGYAQMPPQIPPQAMMHGGFVPPQQEMAGMGHMRGATVGGQPMVPGPHPYPAYNVPFGRFGMGSVPPDMGMVNNVPDMAVPGPVPSGPTTISPFEGPPCPVHPPTSCAQLRAVILIALINGKSVPPYPLAEGFPAIRQRLALACPIHSAVMAAFIVEYFTSARRIPLSYLRLLRHDAVAQQLRVLGFSPRGQKKHDASGISLQDNCDRRMQDAPSDGTSTGDMKPAAEGPADGKSSSDNKSKYYLKDDLLPDRFTIPLVEIRDLGEGVLVESFDFDNCDKLLRSMLSNNHKSASYAMFDSTRVLEKAIALTRDDIPEDMADEDGSVNILAVEDTTLRESGMPAKSFVELLQTEKLGADVSQADVSLDVASGEGLGNSCSVHSDLSGSHGPSSGQSSTAANNNNREPAKSSSLPASTSSTERLNLEDLISAPSAKEKKMMANTSEIRDLLTVPTAKHSITARTFQNPGGSRVRQICPHGTRYDCFVKSQERHQQQGGPPPQVCSLVHFKRIIYPHTDVSLGDCSYLDTCRHIETCKFLHYEVDDASVNSSSDLDGGSEHGIGAVSAAAFEESPAQWINCDIRHFDWTIFKDKVKVLMADPPWDIHMDLPYGTLTDNEMRSLKLHEVHDAGLIFLWVTGRAMELGRECMKLWGYRFVEELVWVKTNQLHRIIRTGRTGHWLNHSKEHCLIGIKGDPKTNKLLDADIIVSVVRETSRKPDEVYRIIERLCPGPYKLELFGRPHNIRNNWLTLGNQLDGTYLHDPQLIQRYNDFAANNNLPLYAPPIAGPEVVEDNTPGSTNV